MPWSSSRRTPPPPPPEARGTAAFRLRWTAPFPGGVNIVAAPTPSGLWVASADGQIALLDPATGVARWSQSVGRAITAGVGASEGLAAVATADGSLLTYGAEGKSLWSVRLGAEAVTVPAVTPRGVFVRCSDRRILGFDRTNGRPLWALPRSAPNLVLRQTSGMALADGRLFLGLPGGRLAAFEEATGSQIWETAVAVPRGSNEIERIADVVGFPSAFGQDVCAVAFQGRVACLDSASGRVLWSRELSSSTGMGGTASTIAMADAQGHVHAFSRSGSSLWRQAALAGRSPSAPAFLQSRLIVSDRDGYVYALKLDDGSLDARIATDGRPSAGAPIVAGDLVLVQTVRGALYALSIGAA
jgi:outer membrane protein assembly factor BamB